MDNQESVSGGGLGTVMNSNTLLSGSIASGSIYSSPGITGIYSADISPSSPLRVFTSSVNTNIAEIPQRLAVIESRLNILRPNAELESRWEELRTLGERYRELEAEIIAKEHLVSMLSKG